MDRKVYLYIAMSIDGYIAKDEDNIDFLNKVEQPGEDYGYAAFQKEVDTLIWGRKTYDKVLSLGIDFPHKDKTCYVLSRTRAGQDENVHYYNGPIKDLIQTLKKEEGKHIYCDGGAALVFELLKEKLIDTFIISIIPHLVGHGIKLFKDGAPEQELAFKKCEAYPSGLVQLWYTKKENN